MLSKPNDLYPDPEAGDLVTCFYDDDLWFMRWVALGLIRQPSALFQCSGKSGPSANIQLLYYLFLYWECFHHVVDIMRRGKSYFLQIYLSRLQTQSLLCHWLLISLKAIMRQAAVQTIILIQPRKMYSWGFPIQQIPREKKKEPIFQLK